jgi:hypothetical protein
MRRLNNALIVLLPKKEGAMDVKDFRPISLRHSFRKLFSKLLATRLAPRLSELIAANQSAFVKGRSIHDNFKMVQLTTHALHTSRTPSLLLKVDITKAFDSVSWPFFYASSNTWVSVACFENGCASSLPPPRPRLFSMAFRVTQFFIDAVSGRETPVTDAIPVRHGGPQRTPTARGEPTAAGTAAVPRGAFTHIYVRGRRCHVHLADGP